MKRLRTFTTGIVLGITLAVTTSVLAENGIVSATLVNDVRFFFKTTPNEVKTPPEEYPVLIYNGRVYTSAKFIGEELGASVEWDEDNRYVVVTPPEPQVVEVEKIVEKIVEVPVEKEEEEKKITRSYSSTPIKYNTNEYELTITGINKPTSSTVEQDTKIYVYLENKGSNPLQLLQGKTVVEMNEEPWPMASNAYWSRDWYNDIQPDTYVESYISINRLPEDAQYVHLELQLLENDRNQTVHTIEFNIRL